MAYEDYNYSLIKRILTPVNNPFKHHKVYYKTDLILF